MPTSTPVRAPRGTQLRCKGWHQEAALRMLTNNLDPDVAERPDDLIVYGGTGKAARNWDCFHAIVRALESLENDETLLVQSGKPVGIFRTHEHSPRVLIANANLVGKWSDWEHFRDLERQGLMMYGQMTAGSWIYIGSQGIVQGTFETFAAAGRKHFGKDEGRRSKGEGTEGQGPGSQVASRRDGGPERRRDGGTEGQASGPANCQLPTANSSAGGELDNRLIVSGGMGGMGGAQPLAATLNGARFLGIDVDPARIEKRLKSGYCDQMAWSLDEALAILDEAKSKATALSVGLVGNCADVIPELARRGIVPDVLTDQTSAHDPLNGYVPAGLSLAEASELRRTDPDGYVERSLASMAVHVRAMLELQKMGAVTFDYGNNIRTFAHQAGVTNAYDIPGFVPEYIRPMFCEGRGPFRWVALSGDPEDIRRTDRLVLELFPRDDVLSRWIHLAAHKIQFQGLPARICWLGYGERAEFGLAMNDLVRKGELKAPIVIGRDHLDCGSVASPYRETEGMKDGSDAVADWPLLNAMLNTAAGASWVSIHNGGGVGIGYSQHAGMVVVADGTKEMDLRLERVLTTDPGTGVMRHVDAGYEAAAVFARTSGLKTPLVSN